MTEPTAPTEPRTQRITMNGRTYIFVNNRHPELDGHDNVCVGHLLNSRHEFAGYVSVMVRTGTRLLAGGPRVSLAVESEALGRIVFSGPLKALIQSRRSHLLATEALTAAGIPFTENWTRQSIRILLPGWGDMLPEHVVNAETGKVDGFLLRAAEAAKVADPGRTRDQVRADWARIARQAVSYSDDLTTTERATLHEAAEILKGRPDLLAEWIEAAQAEGAILGPSANAVRDVPQRLGPHRHSASCYGAIGELLCKWQSVKETIFRAPR